MYLLAVNLNVLATLVLLVGAVVLGVTIYFFIVNRRTLKQTLDEVNENVTVPPGSSPASTRLSKVADIAHKGASLVKKNLIPGEKKPLIKAKTIPQEESIESLKETVVQQQKLLSSFLRQVEEIEHEGREELELQNGHLQNEIKGLEAQLEKKDMELEELRKQASMAERMAARIDQVYEEFEQLQAKMVTLEKQAGRANNLALELEDTRQAYEQVHKDLLRKTEKLEETYLENQRLQQQLNMLEDKLAEANLQRQQLQRKVQFLEDLNTDLQTVSDTNKKLQTELRRVGELESMLNMISEERDYLLRKKERK